MTLSFKDLEFRTEVPDIPRSLPVTQTIAQCAPERSRSVRALADHFGIMAAFYFLAGTIIVANLMIFVTPSGATKNT